MGNEWAKRYNGKMENNIKTLAFYTVQFNSNFYAF